MRPLVKFSAGTVLDARSEKSVSGSPDPPVFFVPAIVRGRRPARPPRSITGLVSMGIRIKRQTEPLPPASRPRRWAPRLFPDPANSRRVSSPDTRNIVGLDKMSSGAMKIVLCGVNS